MRCVLKDLMGTTFHLTWSFHKAGPTVVQNGAGALGSSFVGGGSKEMKGRALCVCAR